MINHIHLGLQFYCFLRFNGDEINNRKSACILVEISILLWRTKESKTTNFQLALFQHLHERGNCLQGTDDIITGRWRRRSRTHPLSPTLSVFFSLLRPLRESSCCSLNTPACKRVIIFYYCVSFRPDNPFSSRKQCCNCFRRSSFNVHSLYCHFNAHRRLRCLSPKCYHFEWVQPNTYGDCVSYARRSK